MDYLVLLVSISLALAACSTTLSVLVDDSGMVSLAHGGLAAVGGYTWVVAVSRWGLDGFSAMILAGVVGVAIGALSGVALARLQGDHFVLGSLALQLGFVSILRNWSGLTNGNLGMSVPSFGLSGHPTVAVLWGAGVVIILSVAMTGYRGSFRGTVHHAIRDDSLLARSLGRSAYLNRTAILAASSAIVAVTGAQYGLVLGFLHPDSFSLDLSILLLTIVVLGGRLGGLGLLVASLLIILVPEGLRFLPANDAIRANIRQIVFNLFLAVGVWVRFRRSLPRGPSAGHA